MTTITTTTCDKCGKEIPDGEQKIEVDIRYRIRSSISAPSRVQKPLDLCRLCAEKFGMVPAIEHAQQGYTDPVPPEGVALLDALEALLQKRT